MRKQAKIDRGYHDFVEGRTSDALWGRTSAEWETELATVSAELSTLERPATTFVATGRWEVHLGAGRFGGHPSLFGELATKGGGERGFEPSVGSC